MVVKLALKRTNENIQIWSRYSLFKNTGCSLPASSSAALSSSSSRTMPRILTRDHVTTNSKLRLDKGNRFGAIGGFWGRTWSVRSPLCIRFSRRERVHTYVIHHDDVIKRKYFPRYWPFVREIHRIIPYTKASDAELWCFLWSVPE